VPCLLLLAVIPVVAMLVSAQTMPEAGSVPDPDLYVSAGCAGCHGYAADGAFGPTLAATGLTFEAFLEQLRSPTGIMPPVDASRVSDEQVRSLYDYVRALEEPEGGPIAGTGCAHGCRSQCSHEHGRHCGHGHKGGCRHGDCAGRSAG